MLFNMNTGTVYIQKQVQSAAFTGVLGSPPSTCPIHVLLLFGKVKIILSCGLSAMMVKSLMSDEHTWNFYYKTVSYIRPQIIGVKLIHLWEKWEKYNKKEHVLHFCLSSCHDHKIISLGFFLYLVLGNNPIQNHIDLKTTNVSLYLL